MRLETGDFDDDGTPDLVARSLQSVELLQGLGGGAFAQPTQILSAPGVRDIDVADFDLDGVPDILLAADLTNFDLSTTETYVMRAVGDGSFEPLAPLPGFRITGVIRPDRVLATDLDEDGDEDVAVLLDGAGAQITTLINPIPEPAVGLGIGAGAALLIGLRRRRAPHRRRSRA